MPLTVRLDLAARAAELVSVRDVHVLPNRLAHGLPAPPVVRGAVFRHALPAVHLESVTPVPVAGESRERQVPPALTASLALGSWATSTPVTFKSKAK